MASQKSHAGPAALPGVRLPAAELWRAPRRGPRAGPSISTASLPVTQHPPPALLLPPAPGDRRHHSAGRGTEGIRGAPGDSACRWPGCCREGGNLSEVFTLPFGERFCSGNAGLRPRHVVGRSPRPFPAVTGVFQPGPRWEKQPRRLPPARDTACIPTQRGRTRMDAPLRPSSEGGFFFLASWHFDTRALRVTTEPKLRQQPAFLCTGWGILHNIGVR